MKQILGKCAVSMLLIAACTPVVPAAVPTASRTTPNSTASPIAQRASTPTPLMASDAELASRLDSVMAGLEANLSFSGAVLVAREGKILLSKGYGYSNRQDKLPNTDQTRFRIASITKQFTAMAILLLEARGKLDVNGHVCDYLPVCPPAWKAITLHELLTHTSGIPEYKDLPDYPAFRAGSTDPAALMARFADLPLAFEPRKSWGYSNSGYVVLGAIVEQASGMTYETFVKENILRPLNMTETGLLDLPPDLAMGYENSFTGIPAQAADASVEYAAGGLYSTVRDLYLWDQALFSDQLIPKDLRDRMFTPYVSMPDSGGLSYGYGCQIGNMDGHRLIGHSGLLEGFSSMNMDFPDDQVVVILLGNQRNPSVFGIGIQLANMALKSGY